MNKIDFLLQDLKARQDAGEYMLCPRCGLDTMLYPPTRNALSRIADVCVCPDCGMDEAKLAFMNAQGTLYEWAALQPTKPASDFKARSAESVWQEVQGKYGDDILRLCRDYLAGEVDNRETRFRAFEQLPGLNQIWTQPFVMRFDCAEGCVQVEARFAPNGATELIGSVVTK